MYVRVMILKELTGKKLTCVKRESASSPDFCDLLGDFFVSEGRRESGKRMASDCSYRFQFICPKTSKYLRDGVKYH